MFRNMVTSLFKHDRIRTTDAKAKELRRWADNLITLAKRGDLSARRQALAIVRERAVVQKLFSEAEERFGLTAGGYTRVVRLGHRPGDAAPVSVIELIAAAPEKKKARKKKKAKASEKKPATPKQAGEKAVEKAVTAAEETRTESRLAETAPAAAPALEAGGSVPEPEKAPDKKPE